MAEKDKDTAKDETKKDETKSAPKKLTLAEIVKLCKRTVAKVDKGQIVKDKDGNPVTEEQPIALDEVFSETSFAEYEDHVVVVLKDGTKWSGAKPKK